MRATSRKSSILFFSTKALVAGFMAVFAFSCAVSAESRPSAPKPETVSIRFPIPAVESGQATFYVAEDRGYYSDEKLRVNFEMGSPELNPVKMVASGADQFGIIGGPDTVLTARARGLKIKAIAIIHRNSNFSCLLTLASSKITKVEQLEGKKVGLFYGHISTDVIHSLFRQTGTKVTEVDTGFDYNQLISGKVDASWAFTVTAGIDLPAKGIPVNVINPADYGIVTHGYTIFATDEMIEKHPDVVLRFLRASLKGIRDVVSDPTLGVNAIHKRAASADVAILARRQAAYNAVTSSSKEYPAGYMDRKMWQETYDRLNSDGLITSQFNISDAYTTKFLERIYGRKF